MKEDLVAQMTQLHQASNKPILCLNSTENQTYSCKIAGVYLSDLPLTPTGHIVNIYKKSI